MIKAILFDHDGTLVDSEVCHCEIWNRVLAPYGVHLSFSEFAAKCIGVPVDKTAELLVELYQIPVAATVLADIKNAASDQFQLDEGFPSIAGAMELLREMSGLGLQVAIVSGAGRASVMNTVHRHELEHELGAIVTAQDVVNNKPAADGYLQALGLLGVAPSEAIAIEDSASGIASAKAAGLKCLAIHHHFIDRNSLLAADEILDNHRDIRTALLTHIK
jgi:HAD superfamily hydrolase (TIGR01509 family)